MNKTDDCILKSISDRSNQKKRKHTSEYNINSTPEWSIKYRRERNNINQEVLKIVKSHWEKCTKVIELDMYGTTTQLNSKKSVVTDGIHNYLMKYGGSMLIKTNTSIISSR